MFEKIKELCNVGIESGEQLLRTTIMEKNKRKYVRGKIDGYKNVLSYINMLEKKEKK